MDRVLDILESITERVRIPVLFDGDTGYGSFNHFQLLVRKLCARSVAGVCIEDKVFPKVNSFVQPERHALVPIEEFCGKIKAGKDHQSHPNFVIVARTEAFISGLGLREAVERATQYAEAGADAILVHSKAATVSEVASFMAAWKEEIPVLCIPTTYGSTLPEVFSDLGLSIVILANHLLRSSVKAMKETAAQLYHTPMPSSVEARIATMRELFRLQDMSSLAQMEVRYGRMQGPRALILAENSNRTKAKGQRVPPCLPTASANSALDTLIRDLRLEGIRRVALVKRRGLEAELPADVERFELEDDAQSEIRALGRVMSVLDGDLIVVCGDVLVERSILRELLSSTSHLTILVDGFYPSRVRGSAVRKVKLSGPRPDGYDGQPHTLIRVDARMPNREADGEWLGVIYARGRGTAILRESLGVMVAAKSSAATSLDDLLNYVIEHTTEPIRATYVRGGWTKVGRERTRRTSRGQSERPRPYHAP